MLEESFALPDVGEQEYLLAGLARLISLRGPEALVAAPLLLPEPEFWPDRVEARGHAAAILLRRLLHYAGLGHLGVDVEIGGHRPTGVVDEPTDDDDPMRHAAGWFMGIADEVCFFGLSNSTLLDEESLIGTLGHEVAHAYRDYHGLVVPSRDVEEQLTDLTTVYLGFGVFVLQSSFQFKTGHRDEHGQQLLYERRMLGYLRPGQLALLLAAQLVVRKQGKRELERVLRALEPNHRAAVEKAYRSLEPERDALMRELGLPPVERWPEPYPLSERTGALSPATIRVADLAEEERQWTKENKIAFRVRSDFVVLGAAVGGVSGFFSFLIDGVGLWMWPLTLGLGTLGYRVGRAIPSARCSSCHHRVEVGQSLCTFCDTPLVGTIAASDDRLEAEERYWEERTASDEPTETR